MVCTAAVTLLFATTFAWEAHVDFSTRPRVESHLEYVFTDELNNTLSSQMSLGAIADPGDSVSAWLDAMENPGWKGTGVRASGLLVVNGSANAPVKKVEFTSVKGGWVPTVTMLPVLRAPSPAVARDKK